MNSNTKRLLVLMGLLVGIKLIILPILNWQNAQVETLQANERRIQKAQAIIDEQAAMESALAASKSILASIEKQFPQYPNSEIFRLEVQKNFETLVSDHGLELRQVFWRDNEDVLVSGNLYRAKLSLRLGGELNHFLQFQLALEQKQLSNQMKGLALQMRGISNESAGNVKGLVTFDVYYYRGVSAS